jgi:endonuclease/exonuclease/phosphatase (EEP) superfamily protein YafD
MLRRILAAAALLTAAAVLLVAAWPQLFALQRSPGAAQVVSLRGLAIAVAAVAIVVLLLVIVISPAARRFAASLALLLVVFSLVNAAVLASRGFGSIGFATAAPRSVTVLSWNTLGDAPGAKVIADLALESGANVVALPETTNELGLQVAELMARGGQPMQTFTVAFDQISKARSTTLLVADSLGAYVVDEQEPNSLVLPTVIARPVSGQGPTILAVHLVAPIPGELARWQQDLDWISRACTEGSVILAGDFNSTLDHFSGLESSSTTHLGECVDAAHASDNGAVGTWPTGLPALVGAPIDHVMATEDWRVTGMRVIENYDKHGSDHRPVLAQLTPS